MLIKYKTIQFQKYSYVYEFIITFFESYVCVIELFLMISVELSFTLVALKL